MKSNTKEFIDKSKLIHGTEYDYSLVEYKNNYTKIKIICHIHGIFEQTPNSHLNGQKCFKCLTDKKTKNKEQFIKDAIKIHGDKYDYSLVEYKNNITKIKIVCPEHGIFEQRPSNHLSGNGCIKCGNDVRKNKTYIEDCHSKFHNKYDYSLVEYKNNKIKVKIICPEHGVFEQTLKDHLKGKGCPYCSLKKMNNEMFIKKANIKHNSFFDYSLVNYTGAFKKVKIICPVHGLFEQVASTHLFGAGCPICKSSKGEKEIISYLTRWKIGFNHQYKFNDCKYVNELIFDFYIPDKNLCIEFNGLQHYKPSEYFGGLESFNMRKNRDEIKKKYCRAKKIKLRIITYRDSIEKKLIKILND